MIRKTIKGGDFKSQMVGELVFDQVPEEGSFNPVTSDAVAKIAGGVADIEAIVPEGASEENKLATAADVAGVQEDVDAIEGKIPSDTSTTNKLVNESGLQDAIDNASESWSTGFTPKGESSVSDLNDLATQSNGDSYIVTDSGTLTDGSLAVVAGDQVAWDATNSVWYKLPQYALKSVVDNISKSIAEEFVPNSTTTVAGVPYMYKDSLYVAKEVYQGPWDASKFDQLPLSYVVMNSLRGCGRLKAGMFSNDLDSMPDNSIYACIDNTDGESFSNRPSTTIKQFTIVTMSPKLPGGDGNCMVQIFSASNGMKFMRSCWTPNSWSEWINLSNVLTTVHIASSPSSPYDDLNTYPKNSVILYTNSGEVAHSPVTNGFNVFTFGTDASALTQILTSQSGEKFIRSKWGSWTQWTSITDYRLVVNPTTSSSPWNDLDNYPLNSSVLVSSGESSVSHKPTSDSFTCLTIGANAAAMTQILSTAKRVTWIRSKWGSTWGDWVQVKSYLDYNDVLAAFTNIVCVGDSLTYSQVYTSENGSRQAYKPWPTVLGTITGAVTFNLGNSGDTAADAWLRWKDTFEAKTNALAIIYLGTNHGLTDTLDTDAPASDPYNSWANTNTGCYAKIVAKLQELGYKVLLVKPWAVSYPGVLSTTQKVVDDVGQRFGCTVVGPISNSSDEFHFWPDRSGRNNTHMNDLGYSWFAHELVRIVSSVGDSMKWIIPS